MHWTRDFASVSIERHRPTASDVIRWPLRAMQSDTKVLRIKTGVGVLCVFIYFAGVVLLSLHLPFGISDRHRIWLVPIYAVLGVLWLVDIFTRRIVLGPDSIRIISFSDHQYRTVPRTEIESVTWEKGCGASLIMRAGRGIRLPNVGRDPQGLTNTIRAWLKKTKVRYDDLVA
jgi:hypothetical protein